MQGVDLNQVPIRLSVGLAAGILRFFSLWRWYATFDLKGDTVRARDAEADSVTSNLGNVERVNFHTQKHCKVSV